MQSYKDNDLGYVENQNIVLVAMSILGDRAEQQDCFGFHVDEEVLYAVVCDGMGGYEGGRFASSVAVKTFLNFAEEYGSTFVPENLCAITNKANNEILGMRNEKMRCGSTLVSVVVKEGNLFWNSVGDSRGYLFRGGSFVQFTKDQNYKTVLDERIEAGLIKESEYKKEIVRGEALICYLGMNSLDLIDHNSTGLKLTSNDMVVLMSDGLYKVLPDEEIASVLLNFTDLKDALYALELKVRSFAKNNNIIRDNMTVLIIKIK